MAEYDSVELAEENDGQQIPIANANGTAGIATFDPNDFTVDQDTGLVKSLQKVGNVQYIGVPTPTSASSCTWVLDEASAAPINQVRVGQLVMAKSSVTNQYGSVDIGDVFKITSTAGQIQTTMVREFSLRGPVGPQGEQGIIGPQGERGPKGDGYNYRDEWNSSTIYYKNDVVEYNGSAYVCKLAMVISAESPDKSDSWGLFVSKGNPIYYLDDEHDMSDISTNSFNPRPNEVDGNTIIAIAKDGYLAEYRFDDSDGVWDIQHDGIVNLNGENVYVVPTVVQETKEPVENHFVTVDSLSPEGYSDGSNVTMLVTYNGNIYSCLGTLVDAGLLTVQYNVVLNIKGEQGVGYNYMGNWISQNEYHENDNVTYNGTTYVCIKAVNGSSVTPDTDTTHWHVFAAAATKDNFPLSAQNQLYAHYIAIYNSPSSGANDNNFMCYFINASSVEYDNLDTLKTGFVGRMLCNGKVMYVGKIHHVNYLYKLKNNIYLNITDLSTGLSNSVDISTIDGYDSLIVDDTVIALGSNNGANALVLYADKNGVILDSDSETVMVQKMLSMTEKGTDFNAVVSAMEANGYKVTK